MNLTLLIGNIATKVFFLQYCLKTKASGEQVIQQDFVVHNP